MRKATRVLDRAKVEVGRETTVRNDLPFAEGKVKARIKVLISTPDATRPGRSRRAAMRSG